MKTVEELLYEYPNLSKEILRLNQQLSDFIKSKDDIYGSLNCNTVKTIPSGNNDNYDPILETITRFEEHIKKLSDDVNNLIDQKEKTEKFLFMLNPQEKRIVELRYFYALGWYQVSVRAHYNERWCKEINKNAIQKIKRYLPH